MTSSWFFLSSLNNDARSTAQSELLRQFFRDRKNTLRVSTTHHQNYVFDRTDLIKVSTLVLGRKAIVMSLYEKRERETDKKRKQVVTQGTFSTNRHSGNSGTYVTANGETTYSKSGCWTF